MEAAMNPVDNVFVSLRMQKTRLTAGAVGVALGLLLTLGFVFLKTRTSSKITNASQ
jgi:hypothetical protein